MSTLHADAVTVEYEAAHRLDAIKIVPFPDVDPDDGRSFTLVGTIEEMRGVVDTMSRLLDDLEEQS